ncbi:MAG: hypothetical protein GWO16_05665 [Gammaproteobacteria bacterium]|nr:hypothetical protein [Gammaproteobacteria bacterium]NIR98085.1 hypothetical protein [Gammaproteobacteria bacterium]NIT63423.1 hypothetical protein [Gammaproteobacteria bacterium]NIV20330.1 hypothetical protein [Gammaproteobacteria bacterium]NIX10807.1 hypothetical protein [Gammaproteobacteria bacterium]
MSTIVLQPTETAHWRDLVHEAARACERPLQEELESYLVFLLMRFAARPEMAGTILALEYLEGLLRGGRGGSRQLREVGDQCLLYSGLFPLRARRRTVQVRYYVDMGRSAYHRLAESAERGWGHMYHQLCESFVALMDVLQAMRELDCDQRLDELTLHELWDECGSRRAGQALRRRLGAGLARGAGERRH